MLVKRETIQSLILSRNKTLELYSNLKEVHLKLCQEHSIVKPYEIVKLEFMSRKYDLDEIKEFDKYYWHKLLLLFSIERFMLCTEYEKIKWKILDDCDFLPFTEENVQGFLESCSAWIKDGVNEMLKRVFEQLIDGYYYVGKVRKKRNLNGVAKDFILYTFDYNRIAFYRDSPTITDDLEKLCFLIAGKELPKIGMIQQIEKSKIFTAENDYFSIRVCKNGNTHYKFKDGFEKKINFLYADRTKIGDATKIKIL